VTHIQNLLAQPACRALGWALLHFLWQGMLAALLLAGCNRALRDSSARARYAVSCLFLMVLLALPMLTFTASLVQAPAIPVTPARFPVPLPAATPLATTTPVPQLLRASLQESLTPLLPWVVALWIAGVVVLSTRWIGAWAYLHRLRRAVGMIPVPPDWGRALHDLMRRAAISAPVRLSIHGLTQVPCVIGWLRPVILMPAASLTGLDWRALEALLAHELAHIRRHDYLVNLVQTTVDTLLFYHPAVWWVSRQIRIERENCCDDFAAQLCGDRVTYARALVDLEQIRAAEPAFAMSARGGSLMHRIQRLLSPGDPERRGPAWLPALAGVAVVACVVAALHAPVHAEGTTRPVSASRPATLAQTMPPAARRPVVVAMSAAQDTPEPPAAQPEQAHDFLTGIVAAGFRNLTVDELIDLKIHGVTPEFALNVKQAGFTNVTAHELVDMSIHGVDVNFMRGMKSNGLNNLSIADLVSLRIHGVTPDYMAELKGAGYRDLSADEYRQLRIHGVDAAFIRHLSETGIKNLTVQQLIRLRQSGL
jgi:beta-lactamase regulating signal transducer with metallopeptidase domain